MPGVSTSSISRYSTYSSYPSYRTSSTLSSSIGRTSSLERSSYVNKDNVSLRTPYKSSYGSSYASSTYSSALPPKPSYSNLNDNYRTSKSLRVSPVRSTYSRISSDYNSGLSDISRDTRYSTGRRRESSSSRDSGYTSTYVSKDHDYSPTDYSSSRHLDWEKTDTSSKLSDRLRSYDTPKLDPVEKRLAERRKRLGLSPTKDTPSRPNLPRYRKPEENGTSSYANSRYNTYRNESRLVGNSEPYSYSSVGRTDPSRWSLSSYKSDTSKEINGTRDSSSPEKTLNGKNVNTDVNDSSSPISRQNSYSKSENIRDSSPVEKSNKLKDDEIPSRKRITALNNSFSENDGLIGLRNIGNTCFMNSITQCLSNTKCILDYLLHDGYSSDINTTLSTTKGQLIKAFANLLSDLWNGGESRSPVNTSSFKTEIQRFSPTFIGYAQHDAQEFLRKLLEGLHEDVNRVCVRPKPITEDIDDSLDDHQKAMESWKRYLRYDDSCIVDMFVGQLKSSLQCSVCSHRSVTFDPFWDLSLPIPNKVGQVRLSQCLDLFTKEEVLDNNERPTCSRCKERRRMTKTFSIQKFPKVLVLHLKRFSPTERWRGKLTCMVDFPLVNLDLSKFASSSNISCQYRLIGIANHSGTVFSGHYTAYCRHPYMGTWHEYNDSRVTSLSASRICNPEAYVLFYELTAS